MRHFYFQCGHCPVGWTGNGFYCNDIDECLTNNGGCSQSPRVQCINTQVRRGTSATLHVRVLSSRSLINFFRDRGDAASVRRATRATARLASSWGRATSATAAAAPWPSASPTPALSSAFADPGTAGPASVRWAASRGAAKDPLRPTETPAWWSPRA